MKELYDLLDHAIIHQLGWTLLHFLWQGILVAGLYALARALAGGRISARGRYAIACASLLAMTVAPALTYWWLGNSGQAARIGDLTDWGARQLAAEGCAYDGGKGRKDAMGREFDHGGQRPAQRQIDVEADIGVEDARQLAAHRRPARTVGQGGDRRKPARFERLQNAGADAR